MNGDQYTNRKACDLIQVQCLNGSNIAANNNDTPKKSFVLHRSVAMCSSLTRSFFTHLLSHLVCTRNTDKVFIQLWQVCFIASPESDTCSSYSGSIGAVVGMHTQKYENTNKTIAHTHTIIASPFEHEKPQVP